jgi:hypothetical protein
MPGGALAHAALSASVSSALRQLPPTSRVLSSEAKVRVEVSDLAAFADVSVVERTEGVKRLAATERGGES